MGCGKWLNPFRIISAIAPSNLWSGLGLPTGAFDAIVEGRFWDLGSAISKDWSIIKHFLMPDMRQDREAMTNSPSTARSVVYGRVRVSGQLAYVQTTGGQNEFLHMIIVLAGHPVDGFEDVYLNDEKASDLSSVCSYEFFDGTQTAACQSLIDVSGGLWTADHKLLGCAYIYLKLTYDNNHFNSGIPTVRVVVRGNKVYDPRTATTAWSDNPALCVYDYMMMPTINGGMGCLSGEVDEAAVIAAANICDELVAAAADGTTEKRYTCNGAMPTNGTPKQLMEALLQSMCGDAVYSGGVWRIYAGAYYPVAESATIDESWLNGGFSFSVGASKSSRFNTITGTYTDPSDNWGQKGFDVVTDPGFLAEDNDEELKNDITLNFTTSASTARRIAKILLRRSRLGTSLDYPCNLKAFGVEAHDIVSVNNSILGWSGKTFRVSSWGFSHMGGVSLSLTEESPWCYEWGVGDFGPISAYVPPTLPDLQWRHQTILPAVTGLGTIYQGRQLWLTWRPISAFDPVRYEVRYGDNYNRAIVYGVTSNTIYPTIADGTYWVTAVTDWGRSSSPATVSVANSTLSANVVQSYDEPGTGWSGTLTGGAEIDGSGRLWLKSVDGVVQSSGIYEQPAGHIVDVGAVQDCHCYCLFIAGLDSPYNSWDDFADFDTVASVDGTYNGEATAAVEINTSQDAHTWDGWQTLVPGPYRARRYKFRVVMSSSSPSVTVAVSGLTLVVDMPDRIDPFTALAIPAGGSSITYSKPFSVAPNVQVTVINAQSGDYATVTGATTAGCIVQVLNGGSGVARTVNIIAQGY